MPLSPALSRWLEGRGHDAAHAALVGLNRATDQDIMTWVVGDGRITITADLDYPRLLALSGANGPSLMLFRGGDWSDAEIINRMAEILAELSETDLRHSILVVERDRIRRRRLPIG
jgi:predicted nuclease of predicted toxin-antitoxin system